MKKVISFILSLSLVLCVLDIYYADENERIKSDADLFYTEIHEFLDNNAFCTPEDFEDVCVQYMLDNSAPLEVLDQKSFESEFRRQIISL